VPALAIHDHPIDARSFDLCAVMGVSQQPQEVIDTCKAWYDQTMPSNSLHSESLHLLGFYTLRNPEGVSRFVADKPTLVAALRAAAFPLMSYFADGRLFLDTYPDHEEPGYVILALRIQTRLRYPETRRQLKAFLSEWWRPNVSEEDDYDVAIGVEPV
jgi:hypothetical protein